MDQSKTGKFIATLRKEKKMTQEQLAERLGVNHRSVSRWENGHCMPDLSLLQMLSEELDAEISEILSGRRMTGDEGSGLRDSMNESLGILIALSNREKQQKAKGVAAYFMAGLVCLVAAMLHDRFHILAVVLPEDTGGLAAGILMVLGLVLEGLGFYHNRQNTAHTSKDIEMMTKRRGGVRMRTAREMLHYAKRFQDVDLKPYESAFKAVAKGLTDGENVVFAVTGTSYRVNELPMMWHVALAVTKDRLIVGGGRMKGMLMVRYVVQSFAVADVLAVGMAEGAMMPTLVIKTAKGELKIEVESTEVVGAIVEELRGALCLNGGTF